MLPTLAYLVYEESAGAGKGFPGYNRDQLSPNRITSQGERKGIMEGV